MKTLFLVFFWVQACLCLQLQGSDQQYIDGWNNIDDTKHEVCAVCHEVLCVRTPMRLYVKEVSKRWGVLVPMIGGFGMFMYHIQWMHYLNPKRNSTVYVWMSAITFLSAVFTFGRSLLLKKMFKSEYVPACNHYICNDCIRKICRTQAKPDCPLCRVRERKGGKEVMYKPLSLYRDEFVEVVQGEHGLVDVNGFISAARARWPISEEQAELLSKRIFGNSSDLPVKTVLDFLPQFQFPDYIPPIDVYKPGARTPPLEYTPRFGYMRKHGAILVVFVIIPAAALLGGLVVYLIVDIIKNPKFLTTLISWTTDYFYISFFNLCAFIREINAAVQL